MRFRFTPIYACLLVLTLLIAFGCGGGGTTSSTPVTPSSSGTVQVSISDDPVENWATIGVKVLSATLVPAAGSEVTVVTMPSPAPTINLLQLDQLGEILGNATNIPAGTYNAVKLTLSANPGDVTLIVSGDPESGFDLPAGTVVPSSQIQIVGAKGTTGSLTVPLTIKLDTPLTVTSTSSNALDLEFDLSNPAFIVEHYPAGASAPTWAVDFSVPCRHRPHADLTKYVLRHHYGQVASVATDNTSITINKAYPTIPIVSPETATVSTTTLPILADATNGTLFYNLDGSSPDTPQVLTSFQSVASTLANQYVRVVTRYQAGGTLVATRIYASATFNTVWANPEGHVLHVNTNTNVMHVTKDDGTATAVKIGPNTNFYFQTTNTVLGTGTAFFDGTTPGGLPNVARGFKVNVTIDPLSTTTPPTALSVEIDNARYNGFISQPTSSGFTISRSFCMGDHRGGADNYHGTLNYISSSTANTSQEGTSVNGFYFWDYAYPTEEDTGTNAVADFISATSGQANFGGNVGSLRAYAVTESVWNDPAATSTWAAKWAILMPTPAPIGLVSTPYSTSTNTFTYTVPVWNSGTASSAANPITVDIMTTAGSSTLVYQVDRQNGVITVTQQDPSNSADLAAISSNLAVNVPVNIYGVPKSDGSIKAYTLIYFTHTVSTK